jgi:hypothetical protein
MELELAHQPAPADPLSAACIWGIHGGKTGDADSLFLKQNCVAIGWAKMGDLSHQASNEQCLEL